MTLIGVAAAGSLAMSACGSNGSSGDSDSAGPVQAAETLCPVMWQWVTDVGMTFNEAAADVADIDGAGARRERWFTAFDEIERLDEGLSLDLAALRHDPVLAPLVAEIERDLPLAQDELDDIRNLFDEHPEIDEQQHQDRTMQVIVRLEKVIDLPKPELSRLDTDGTLTPAFQSVPSCQQSIKDVDDGSTQANG